MAIVAPLGGSLYDERGSMKSSVTIPANSSSTSNYDERGSMSSTVPTAVTLTFTTTSPLTAGTQGTSYNGVDDIVATGGMPAYTYAVTSGSTPTGITLNSNGTLTGTPTVPGTSSFTVTATDAYGNTGVQAFSLTINASGGSPTVTTTSPMPNGMNGTAYSQTFTESGGTGPFTWDVSSGTLPTGLTLHASTGVLDGTPTVPGTSSFTIRVTDSTLATGTKPMSLTIVNTLAITTTSPLPDATQSSPYTKTLVASGGTSTYSWAVTVGTLPTGLTLHTSTGVIDGTPTGTGTSSFTITVTDSSTPNFSTPKAFSLTVNAAGGGGGGNFRGLKGIGS